MKKHIIFFSFLLQSISYAQDFNKDELIENLKILASDEMQGRKTGTKGNEKARKFLINKFEEAGLKPFGDSYVQAFSFKRKETQMNGKNIVGYLPGKLDEVIMVTAHYDHLGMKDGVIFNGTDDNATGTSALITMAKYFKKNPIEHTLVFVAFDAEEMGLQGAKAFVKAPPIKLEKVMLNVNMDMVSHNDKNELYASGTLHYPKLKPMLEKADSRSKVALKFGHDDPKLGHDDWTYASDHAPFHRNKIPFVYFGVEDHVDYHKETDEFKNTNLDFYVDAVDLIIKSIEELDKNIGSTP